MIKDVTGLQTLDVEIGILLEVNGTFSDDSSLLTGLKQAFDKDYTEKDLSNLKRYHDFINQRNQFETLSEFTFDWYNTIVK